MTNDTDKPPTRPAVICHCGRVIPFASDRYGRMMGQICPGCFADLYRSVANTRVYARLLNGEVVILEGCEVLKNGI